MKPTIHVDANIHLIQFTVVDLISAKLATFEFNKISFIPESQSTPEEMLVIEELIRVYLEKSVKEDNRLSRLTPFKLSVKHVEVSDDDICHPSKKAKIVRAPKQHLTAVAAKPSKPVKVAPVVSKPEAKVTKRPEAKATKPQAKATRAKARSHDSEVFEGNDMSPPNNPRGISLHTISYRIIHTITYIHTGISASDVRAVMMSVMEERDRTVTPVSAITSASSAVAVEEPTPVVVKPVKPAVDTSSCLWFFADFFSSGREKYFPSWSTLYDRRYLRYCARKKVYCFFVEL